MPYRLAEADSTYNLLYDVIESIIYKLILN